MVEGDGANTTPNDNYILWTATDRAVTPKIRQMIAVPWATARWQSRQSFHSPLSAWSWRRGSSLHFSPCGEANYVRGPSGRSASRLARAGVLEQYVEHGKQAQRSPGGRIVCFDRRVVRNAGQGMQTDYTLSRRPRRSAAGFRAVPERGSGTGGAGPSWRQLCFNLECSATGRRGGGTDLHFSPSGEVQCGEGYLGLPAAAKAG